MCDAQDKLLNIIESLLVFFVQEEKQTTRELPSAAASSVARAEPLPPAAAIATSRLPEMRSLSPTSPDASPTSAPLPIRAAATSSESRHFTLSLVQLFRRKCFFAIKTTLKQVGTALRALIVSFSFSVSSLFWVGGVSLRVCCTSLALHTRLCCAT